MAVEKKVETLEGEIKLMKGELKETLTSVRDFLLNLKIPPRQIEGLEGGETTKVDIGGALSTAVGSVAQVPIQVGRPVEMPQERPVVQQVEPGQPRVVPATEAQTPGQFAEMEAMVQPMFEELWEEEEEPQSQIEEENQLDRLPEQYRDEERSEQVAGSTPQVNLLGNLLRWVSVATREIGNEQLPTFLDIYSVTGGLSPETREVILRFADVVAQQPAYASVDSVWGNVMTEQFATFLDVHSINGKISPDVKEGILRFASTMVAHPSERSIADVWGRLSLELHGILSGGGKLPQTSGMPQGIEEPTAEVNETEEDEGGIEESPVREINETVGQEERTVILKLVLPVGVGVEKEFGIEKFSINVNPETGVENSRGRAAKAKKARRKKS